MTTGRRRGASTARRLPVALHNAPARESAKAIHEVLKDSTDLELRGASAGSGLAGEFGADLAKQSSGSAWRSGGGVARTSRSVKQVNLFLTRCLFLLTLPDFHPLPPYSHCASLPRLSSFAAPKHSPFPLSPCCPTSGSLQSSLSPLQHWLLTLQSSVLHSPTSSKVVRVAHSDSLALRGEGIVSERAGLAQQVPSACLSHSPGLALSSSQGRW